MGAGFTQQSVWALARRQHGVVTRAQLRELGFSDKAIRHRLRKGRLHRVWPDVFAVGRPHLTQEGRWMASVLTGGEGAALSHASAAALWKIRRNHRGPIHISVPSQRDPRREGIKVHRRRRVGEAAEHDGIPVTSPTQTIIDLAPRLSEHELERAINEADQLGLAHPEALHQAANAQRGPGARRVRHLLDRRTFLLTDSELEQRFIPIAEAAGLESPETQVRVNGHRVDFYFRARNLVVEADGGRYHRTPGQQTRDRMRDHAHAVAGTKSIRFTHDQIAHEPEYVARILRGL